QKSGLCWRCQFRVAHNNHTLCRWGIVVCPARMQYSRDLQRIVVPSADHFSLASLSSRRFFNIPSLRFLLNLFLNIEGRKPCKLSSTKTIVPSFTLSKRQL